MTHLLDGKTPIVSAVWITCFKGAVRANHYHKHDTHICYMVEGSMDYIYKDLKKKNGAFESVIVKKGDIVITPPMEAHAMRFRQDSIFLALTTEPRDQNAYEGDTVRIELVKSS